MLLEPQQVHDQKVGGSPHGGGSPCPDMPASLASPAVKRRRPSKRIQALGERQRPHRPAFALSKRCAQRSGVPGSSCELSALRGRFGSVLPLADPQQSQRSSHRSVTMDRHTCPGGSQGRWRSNLLRRPSLLSDWTGGGLRLLRASERRCACARRHLGTAGSAPPWLVVIAQPELWGGRRERQGCGGARVRLRDWAAGGGTPRLGCSRAWRLPFRGFNPAPCPCVPVLSGSAWVRQCHGDGQHSLAGPRRLGHGAPVDPAALPDASKLILF